MRKFAILLILSSLLMIGISANAQGASQSYLIIANGNSVPANIATQVSQAGGNITNTVDAVGLVVAESTNPNFASQIRGVRAVVPNLMVQMTPTLEERGIEMQSIDAQAANPPFSNDDDFFADLQWGNDAVNAPEAWEAGSCGDGALVAVLDGGFNPEHPDIAENVVGTYDATGEGLAYGPNDDDDTGIFSHGMHVAGTIAAADNGYGIIGVAPCADLLLVKVLFNYGSGSFEDVAEGIVYAADYGGVDVINMSLGADIPQGSGVDASGVAALRTLMNRSINYARQQGITVIVAAGNDGRNLDADQSTTVFPASMPGAISISALGPINWAADPLNTSLDGLAIYSNYGRSGISFGAPGGDYTSAFTDQGFEGCTVAGLTRVCYVFDFVFSTGGVVDGVSPRWYWSVGTSMAAPHAAGIAALIVGENGDSMHPAQVEAEMRARAADLGQPGNDPVYGAGRVSSGY